MEDTLTVTGELEIVLRNEETGVEDRQYYKNMVVNTGKYAMAAALRGDVSNNRGIITYCAVGTGTVAPANSDTTLQTELFRKAVSVRSSTNNTAIFRTFFTTEEANGTLREAGLFGDDASATANSGVLFCRTAINRTKTSSDTLTVTWYVTIS